MATLYDNTLKGSEDGSKEVAADTPEDMDEEMKVSVACLRLPLAPSCCCGPQ